jgi:hypothetical protein
MGTLRARVGAVDRVSIPDTGQDAWRITTDLARSEHCFYVDPAGPIPKVGDQVYWAETGRVSTRWVYIEGTDARCHKLRYFFDPRKEWH